MAEKGRTIMPSIKSAQAKETMKRLVAPLNLWVILTAVMTMILPKMTMRQTRPKGNSEPMILASLKSTLSRGEEQFLIHKIEFCEDGPSCCSICSKLLFASWCDSVELKLVLIADASCCRHSQLQIEIVKYQIDQVSFYILAFSFSLNDLLIFMAYFSLSSKL